jgi:hypothetical protein
MTGDGAMPVELAAVLAQHSPRLVVDRSALIQYPASPTGWLLIVPTGVTAIDPADLEIVADHSVRNPDPPYPPPSWPIENQP